MPTLSDLGQLPKRIVLGRAVRSDRLGESLLPKRYALPIFASDPLSSVAYATQEILIVLTLAGTAFLFLAPWLAIAVVLLLATVVLSYRQVVRAYPSGGRLIGGWQETRKAALEVLAKHVEETAAWRS